MSFAIRDARADDQVRLHAIHHRATMSSYGRALGWLDAILAVVLGGTSLGGGKFTLAGSVVGALIIQTLTTTIYALGIPPGSIMLVKSVVVLAVCLLQSPAFRRKLRRRRTHRPGQPAATPAPEKVEVTA